MVRSLAQPSPESTKARHAVGAQRAPRGGYGGQRRHRGAEPATARTGHPGEGESEASGSRLYFF